MDCLHTGLLPKLGGLWTPHYSPSFSPHVPWVEGKKLLAVCFICLSFILTLGLCLLKTSGFMLSEGNCTCSGGLWLEVTGHLTYSGLNKLRFYRPLMGNPEGRARLVLQLREGLKAWTLGLRISLFLPC